MALSEKAEELLVKAWELGVVNIYASDIEPCAEMIHAGYVEARDDPEGPWVHLTERGKQRLKDPAKCF